MKCRMWLIAVMLGLAQATSACPMCKDSISDTARGEIAESRGEPQTSLPSGFNFSVYYMLAGLFATMGLLAGVITRGIRSADAEKKR